MFPSARLHISARQNFLYNTKNLLKPLKCTDQVGAVNLCHCRSTAGINCSRFASKRPFKTNMNIVIIIVIIINAINAIIQDQPSRKCKIASTSSSISQQKKISLDGRENIEWMLPQAKYCKLLPKHLFLFFEISFVFLFLSINWLVLVNILNMADKDISALQRDQIVKRIFERSSLINIWSSQKQTLLHKLSNISRSGERDSNLCVADFN